MKNLFDYATKELSQDSFLRRFFENYDDDQIGPIVVDFINYFSKNQYDSREQFNLRNGDIKQLNTYAQKITSTLPLIFIAINLLAEGPLLLRTKLAQANIIS